MKKLHLQTIVIVLFLTGVVSAIQVTQPINEIEKASCQTLVSCTDCMTQTQWVESQGLLLPRQVWAVKCENNTIITNSSYCVYDVTVGAKCKPDSLIPITPQPCSGCKATRCWFIDTDPGNPKACPCVDLDHDATKVDFCSST